MTAWSPLGGPYTKAWLIDSGGNVVCKRALPPSSQSDSSVQFQVEHACTLVAIELRGEGTPYRITINSVVVAPHSTFWFHYGWHWNS